MGEITEPGIYPDLPLDQYLADPVPAGSLSASGAKLLLPPSCPAKFRHWADHPADRAPKDHFDFGQAVHTVVTGSGPRLVVVDADSWRTDRAKAEAKAIRAAGHIPMLPGPAIRVREAVDALLAHERARQLFECPGLPEATMVWVEQVEVPRDPDGRVVDVVDVWRRARPDQLPDPGPGRLIVPDLKTCDSADPRSAARSMWSYGYHRQAAGVLDGLAALDIDDDAAFVLVFIEKAPPYVVSLYYPDQEALEIGREQNREALQLFAECQASGVWPAYTAEPLPLSVPRWARYEWMET